MKNSTINSFSDNQHNQPSPNLPEKIVTNSLPQKGLISHITNNANEIINFEINEFDYGNQKKVIINVNKISVGEMRFTLHSDHLYINRMDNFSKNEAEPLKRVGSTLFEYAFRRSIDEGLKGRIELDSIDNSPAAYFKMGFRKMSDSGPWLESLINKYKITHDKNFQEEIQNHGMYKFLKEDASSNLNKIDVSFEEAIEHGLLDPCNKAFEELLSSAKNLTNFDCKQHFMQGRMYLPDEIIEQKHSEFFKDENQPIDPTLYFDQNPDIQKFDDKVKEKLFESESQLLNDFDNTLNLNVIGETDISYNTN